MRNGKAIAMGEPEGMIKTVFDAKTGELGGIYKDVCDRLAKEIEKGRDTF